MHEILPIRYSDVLNAPNAAELLAEYSAECSIPEIGPVNPQPQIYAALEANGAVQIFGAYMHGVLRGFASVLVTVLPHYGQTAATVESLFVSAPFRRYSLGTYLTHAIEDYARERGAKVILYSAPTDSKLEKMLSLHKVYRRTNSVFCRPL